jgi:hypothetical protein
MNIKEAVDYLNFWIKKERGSFFTIEESVNIIDLAQIAYFNDIIPRYATSQIVKDTLQPFKRTYNFNPNLTDNGVIYIGYDGDQVELDPYYLDLLDCTISYQAGGRDVYFSVKMSNEDELGDRLNSQINPPTIYSPVAQMFTELIANDPGAASPYNAPPYNSSVSYNIQLYPKVDEYTGFLNYMRRPVKPVYAYDVVGRDIQYIPEESVQLEWRTTDINAILLKALSSLGINLGDQEVMQFAELKSQENYQGVNHL